MKIVHGFLGGLPVLGVRAPVLPAPSVTGDLISSTESLLALSGTGVEPDSTGVDALLGVPSPPPPDLSRSVRSGRSLSFRSFFSFFFGFSRSLFSVLGTTAPEDEPLTLGTGLCLPGVAAVDDGEVEVFCWVTVTLTMVKGTGAPATGSGAEVSSGIAAGGAGVEDALVWGACAGRGALTELGV